MTPHLVSTVCNIVLVIQLRFNSIKTALKINVMIWKLSFKSDLESFLSTLLTSALYIGWAASATAVITIDRSCIGA